MLRDLGEALASDQEEAVTRRFEMFRVGKSNFKTGVLDSSDEYTRNTLSLSGVDSSIETLMTMVSGSYSIPITRLFGTSAKGMNATGENDQKDYDDFIESIQQGTVASSMKHLDQVLVRSALGLLS